MASWLLIFIVKSDSLPAKHFGVGVHDIQRLFEAAILNKANYFTVKGRHIIPVFMQNCDSRQMTDALLTEYIKEKGNLIISIIVIGKWAGRSVWW